MEARKKLIINVAFYLIIFVGIGLVYKVILPIMTPFIIGFCVASFTNYLFRKMKSDDGRLRKLASVLFVIVFYLIIAGIIVALGVKLFSQLFNFVSDIPNMFRTQIIPFLNIVNNYAEKFLLPIDEELALLINDVGNRFIAEMGQYIAEFSKVAIRVVANGLAGIPGLIVSIILTLISTFYFTADYQRITQFIVKLVPEKKRTVFVNGYQYGKKAIMAFLKTYSALLIITCAELCIGFLILKIPYAGLIAVMIAVFDILPLLGVGGILLPWAAIQAIVGDYRMAIGLLLLYLFITVVRNTLESRIVGNQIGLHPLATLMAMILGFKLIGLVGLILFPITLVAVVNMKRISKEVKKEEENKAEKQAEA